jgi:hypothetical protein
MARREASKIPKRKGEFTFRGKSLEELKKSLFLQDSAAPYSVDYLRIIKNCYIKSK